MKHFLVTELKVLISYLKVNLNDLLLSLAIGMFLFWTANIFQTYIANILDRIILVLPSFQYIISFESLIFVVIWKRSISIWRKYRKSYFIKQPRFSTIDGLFLISTFIVWWLTSKHFMDISSLRTVLFPIIIFALITYIKALLSIIKEQKTKNQLINTFDEHTKLLTDEPIEDNSHDLIGRKRFAGTLKNNIYKLSFKKSFVMALYGYWGEGKTSVLNLLKNDLKNDQQLLIYEFDPWFFGEKDALTANFYHGLEDLLEEKYLVPKDVKDYLNFYPEVLINGFANLSLRLNKNIENRPSELKNKIENFVASLDKRILVIIDDIDRLQADEILAVFRLVKLTSRMNNMVFLLCFDPSIVSSTLQNNKEIGDPVNYIEKIIQLPIYLPSTDQRKIDDFLLFSYPDSGHISEIDKFFNEIKIDSIRRKEFDEEFTKTYQSNLKTFFPTYRAAKRYLNSIFFRLPFIEHEIYLYDFFILEVFHTFFPDIYNDIRKNSWFYISPWSLEFRAYSYLPYDNKEKREAIESHVEEIVQNNKMIISLLENIFPQIQIQIDKSNYGELAEDYRIKRRIAHPDCFYKYFALGVHEGVISDTEFDNMLEAWRLSDNLRDDIKISFFEKYQKESKLIDLLNLLKLHAKEVNKEIALTLIRVIYQNCDRFIQSGDLWENEYNQAYGLIFRLLEDNKKIEDNQIQGILKEIIQRAERLDFVSTVVLSCSDGRSNGLYRIHQNINHEELKDVIKRRLKKYFIEENRNVFTQYKKYNEFGIILFQWAIGWSDEYRDRNEEVTDYLIKAFRKNPRDTGFFLRHFVKKGLGYKKEKYFQYNDFKIAYNPDKFSVCLAELGDKAWSDKSEKEAIELFIKANSLDKSKSASISEIVL